MNSEDSICMLRLLMMCLITVAALYDDLKRYKISNKICVAGMLTGVILLLCDIAVGHAAAKYIAGGIAGFVIMLIAHMVMAVGAGDVKLMGALGLIAGFYFINGVILLSFIFTALMGTVLAVCGRCGVKNVLGRKLHTIHFTAVLAAAEFVMVTVYYAESIEKLYVGGM